MNLQKYFHKFDKGFVSQEIFNKMWTKRAELQLWNKKKNSVLLPDKTMETRPLADSQTNTHSSVNFETQISMG